MKDMACMSRSALTFAHFVATPENRAAWLAVQEIAADLMRPAFRGEVRIPRLAHGKPATLMLHGPAGAGKTHLVHALVAQVTQHRPDLVVTVLAAGDLVRTVQPTLFAGQEETHPLEQVNDLEQARHGDLLVVEDLQHLSLRAVESVVQVMDYLGAWQRPAVFTANAGPQRLVHRGERFPARLTTRLAAGLVVALEPLGPASRLICLQSLAQRRQLAVPTEVLRWLADRLTGGGRQLEGAIAKLQALVKLHRGPLELAAVEGEFQEQTDAGRLTVERIAERVGGYFRVDPSDLQSRRCCHDVLLPRQVGMYLARQLTQLSLEEIGQYFGGRDHSTVLHSCRKVEEALRRDAVLSGLVHEIHAALT